MKTFIKVIEIWIPGKDRSILELAGGLYGPFHAFREAAEQQQFKYGEGLPGMAWAEGRPIVLKDFDSSHFRRGPVAKEAGLKAAIALPVFSGEILLAVVMFICGDDGEHAGAIEVWGRDPSRDEMGLVDGYYGSLENFEWISRRVRFIFGQGLPGRVWAARAPMVIEDLSNSSTFLRAHHATEANITTALGIPCLYGTESVYVMAFLSSMGTPIARRFEVWVPDAEQGGLIFQTGQCDQGTVLEQAYEKVVVPKGGGLLGQVWLTGVPQVSESLASDDSATAKSATLAGLGTLFAMPVFDGSVVKAVVALVSD